MYLFFLICERGMQQLKKYILILFYKIRYGKRIKIGKNFKIRKRFNLYIGKNGYLEIGDNCFFNNDCSINCMKKITIGNDNLFGENVKIYDHDHIFNLHSVKRAKEFSFHNIVIGNENWFGSNVTILKKSLIGDRNVIGAGIVINNSVSNDMILKCENEHYTTEKIKYKDEKES